MQNLKLAWITYNKTVKILQKILGRTNNIVGEYSEYLTAEYYHGELLPASHKSADVKVIENNQEILYQVKSRKLEKLTSTQLGIIRSWNFNYLVVIIFDLDGNILKALEVPVDVAKEYAKSNSHQNGWVITTTQKFLNDHRNKIIMTNQ